MTFEHFDEIVGPAVDGQYVGKWKTKWTAIKGLCDYFDKITEELVEPERLLADARPFLRCLGAAFIAYRRALLADNTLDFAHQQKLVYDLLQDPAVAPAVTSGVKYVLVDEYQDTNYIQEQLLFRLASSTGNLCVVGDEDQSLYRFRGGTVRNLLEFTSNVPG